MPEGQLRAPFRDAGGTDRVLVAFFALINGLVLLNALAHNHRVGYDTLDGHLPYIVSLSTLQLPTPETSRSFFAPPLPYLIPALVYGLIKPLAPPRIAGELALAVAGKAGQLQNVALSLLLTFFLLKLCERIRPGEPQLKRGTLAMLALLPVYYKSFAFIRGEPFVACLTVLALYWAAPLLALLLLAAAMHNAPVLVTRFYEPVGLYLARLGIAP